MQARSTLRGRAIEMPTRAEATLTWGRARAIATVAAALLGATATLPGAAIASAAHPTLPEIEPQVMCVTCKIPLNTAESPQANEERAFITEEISAGDDEAELKNALVAQYGSAVLAMPRAEGFDLAVYIVPIAAVVVLIAALALLLPRWLRSAKGDGLLTSSSKLSEADTERLSKDMKRFE
jgi:cytochrome c-type biogenesis protein CcmH